MYVGPDKGIPIIWILYLSPLSVSILCFMATNSAPKTEVPIVACCFDSQMIGAKLQKMINPVREHQVLFSPATTREHWTWRDHRDQLCHDKGGLHHLCNHRAGCPPGHNARQSAQQRLIRRPSTMWLFCAHQANCSLYSEWNQQQMWVGTNPHPFLTLNAWSKSLHSETHRTSMEGQSNCKKEPRRFTRQPCPHQTTSHLNGRRCK